MQSVDFLTVCGVMLKLIFYEQPPLYYVLRGRKRLHFTKLVTLIEYLYPVVMLLHTTNSTIFKLWI